MAVIGYRFALRSSMASGRLSCLSLPINTVQPATVTSVSGRARTSTALLQNHCLRIEAPCRGDVCGTCTIEYELGEQHQDIEQFHQAAALVAGKLKRTRVRLHVIGSCMKHLLCDAVLQRLLHYLRLRHRPTGSQWTSGLLTHHT